MADNFRITAYNAATDLATITFNLDARPDFPAVVNGVQGVSGVPKDTVANVKAYLRKYADAYISGKQAENVRAAAVSSEVAALLNVATGF
jgi:hypothetical protein